MILLYSTAFSIFGQRDSERGFSSRRVYGELRRRILGWLEREYKVPLPQSDLDDIDKQLDPNSHLIAAAAELDGFRMWAMTWTRREEHNPDCIRKLTIGMRDTSEELEIGFSNYMVQAGDSVMPYGSVSKRVPRIVTAIMNDFQCAVGDEIIEPEYRPIEAENLEQFNAELSGERVLPILVVAPLGSRDDRRGLAARLAVELAGQAHVALLASQRAHHFFNRTVPPHLAVAAGAVRLYWPFTAGRPGEKITHQLWLNSELTGDDGKLDPETISESILEKLSQSVAPFFSTRSVQLEDVYALRREQHHVELNRRLEQTRIDLQKVTDRTSTKWVELLETQNENLTERIRLLEEELDDLKAGRYALEQQLSSLSQARRERSGRHEAQPGAPENVYDALRLARRTFGDRLVVLPKAVDTAKDSPYDDPNEVFRALVALALDWYDLKTSNRPEGDLISIFRSRTGFDYAPHESDTATGMYESEYTTTYKGAKRLFKRHLKLGWGFDPRNCLRIHFDYDDEEEKIVIARCGVHPKNTRG